MGLYPPGHGNHLTKPMIDAVTNGVAQPPFKVRDSQKINTELGSDALPYGFAAVPISVFNNDDIHDDVSYDGCPFIEDEKNARIDDDAVFADYLWMID